MTGDERYTADTRAACYTDQHALLSSSSSNGGNSASIGQRFATHKSSFYSWTFGQRTFSRSLETETMEAARSASQGALVFVISAQALLIGMLMYFQVLQDPQRGPEWFYVSFFAFNATFAYAWKSNPGVVRAESREVPATVADETAVGGSRLRSRGGCGGSGRGKQVLASSGIVTNADGIPLRWCDLCELHQPLRSKHCDKCGVCIRKYDHHCFWVGGCVGEENHVRFVVVLLTATVYVFVATFFALTCFSALSTAPPQPPPSWTSLIARNALPFLLSACGVFMWIFVVLLLGFHVFLLLTNQTTWESSSSSRITYFQYTSKRSPFDGGLMVNVKLLLCRNSAEDGPVDWRFDVTRRPSPQVEGDERSSL